MENQTATKSSQTIANNSSTATKGNHIPSQTDSPMGVAIMRNGKYYWWLVVFLVALSALGFFVNDM